MAADKDEIVKKMDTLIEQTKEAKETNPLGEVDDEPKVDVTIGKFVKEIRTALHHGDIGPILGRMDNSFERDDLKNGLPLPKELLKIFDGTHRKTTGYLEEGQLSLGGAVVPEQFEPRLLSMELIEPIMRSRAFTIRGTSQVLKVPRIVETDRSTNIYGGVAANWTSEGTAITVSNPAFGQVALTAKKLALLTYLSNELIDDNAVGLTDTLIRMFTEAMGWFEDKAFINGSGVNEPMGWRNGGAKQASAATTTSTAFLIADACILFAETVPGTENRCIWVMNPSVRRALPQMVSTSAGDNVWYPRNILTVKDSPEPWTLLGMPIYWSEHMAAFGTDEDIAIIDPLNYLVMERQDIRVSVSTDIRFAEDETGYKLTSRTDGQNWVTSALTLADGSTTVSPVVVNNHT
jgi:HK97 family phage major capsid protein